MKRLIIVLAIFFLSQGLFAQTPGYSRKVIDTLASPTMQGRGYTNNGDKSAAAFIKNEFIADKLNSFGNDYYQHYTLSINTFSGKTDVMIDGKKLVPAYDFLISGSSPSINGKFNLIPVTKYIIKHRHALNRFVKKNFSDKFIVIDRSKIKSKDKKSIAFLDSIRNYNPWHAKGIIAIKDTKLTWGASGARKIASFTGIDVKKEKMPRRAKQISLDIEASFLKDYSTQNVIAFVKGKVQPDTFLVFCAHYDHLGKMGKDVYFPGANDNASGTAMVLDLAKYYSKPENQPRYSIAFMTFSGEEAGLLGSQYYTEHPLFPLKNIKLLINLDMVGTGSDGATILNGKPNESIFRRFEQINTSNNYLKKLTMGGVSRSSDHYYFYKNGVPAIFIITGGKDYTDYHNLYDRPEALPLTAYDNLFKLITDFVTVF